MILSSTSTSPNRNGISLFEVLISILVATIGVFGVLVLIPFAVKNAQLGMDREAAINAAKNFHSDFEAHGYHGPYYNSSADPPGQYNAAYPEHLTPGWYDDDTDPHIGGLASTPVNTRSNIVPGWPYLIDPIGCATLGTPYGQFPSFGPGTCPKINRITLLDHSLNPLGLELSRRLCMPQDVLLFDKPATELGPPRQTYYELDDDSTTIDKRQYKGKYSTVMFVVPLDNDMERYRVYTVVLGTGDQTTERVFRVSGPPDPTDQPPPLSRELEGIGLGGGDLELTEIPNGTFPPDSKRAIRNNDWIMLVSYYGEPVGVTYRHVHLNFYSVVNAERDTNLASQRFHVTLQGPDFDFWRDWTPSLNNTSPPQVETFAILVPNVLAVYERTIRREPKSDWQYSE